MMASVSNLNIFSSFAGKHLRTITREDVTLSKFTNSAKTICAIPVVSSNLFEFEIDYVLTKCCHLLLSQPLHLLLSYRQMFRSYGEAART